ncbi:hypothetical protein [Methanoculleus frigidifontis]|uniref:hypothetical protein n=1 Tax=Methanoculleus frigidifontis TaxID=2584085 RepID=UPI00265AFD5F|nr:hypothetical protein [Methanoculleus sp. FWC-SCC1]
MAARLHFEPGGGNLLTLTDDEVLRNLHAVQLMGGLSPSGTLDSGAREDLRLPAGRSSS